MIPITPTTILGASVGILIITNVITFNLWRGSVDEYAEFRANVVAAQEQAKAESERINRETAEGWANAVDWHRNNPRIVRVRNNVCEMPIPAPTGQHDDTPVKQESGSAVIDASRCEELLNNAVLDASHVLHLQNWIRRQAEK